MGLWRRPLFSQSRWTKFAQDLAELKARLNHLRPAELAQKQNEAEEYARRLTHIAQIAKNTLGQKARNHPAADYAMPESAYWGYRPDAFVLPLECSAAVAIESPHDLTGGLKIFHDCAHPEIILRQYPIDDPAIASPYGLSLEVFRFDGSFLSMALDLPRDHAASLRLNDIIRVSLEMHMDYPIDLYARLNVIHGPNSEQMVRKMEWDQGCICAEFDMAYSKINDKRIEKVWIDLIFERPSMNLLKMHDFLVLRLARAEI